MTREEVFVSLHKAHSESWDRQFPNYHVSRPVDFYRNVHEWKKGWWEEMERQFPEYIKGGVATNRAHEAHDRS